MTISRETLEADVVIVGAGPAGLACALRLAQLCGDSKGRGAAPSLDPENIYVLEKAAEIGAHCLSGAVLDPRSLAELIPDFLKAGAPLTPVSKDSVHYFTPDRSFRLPLTPPFLRNHGNYVVSLNRLAKWLGQKTEQAGVSLFAGFAATELLVEDGRVVGVRTDDKGIDRKGKPKSNFQPGYDLRAKVVVLAEGVRGSLTKQLIKQFGLEAGSNPQTYALGVKELWEIPQGRLRAGEVIHTAGWPLTSRQYGGGFIYGLSEKEVSLGLVAGLDYEDPRFDPQEAFQRFKTHPFVRKLLKGGQMIRYGAKAIPEGGYFSLLPTAVEGALTIGDTAGFLNSQRLKGIHLAIKTGMLAAETIFEAHSADDFSLARLSQFEQRWQTSWVHRELWKVRNYRQGFEGGFWQGILHAALQMVTGGRGLRARYPSEPGHLQLKKLSEALPRKPELKADGKLTFDKLHDVYHSGTAHEEDQPPHLRIADFDICNDRCTREYGNPCQHFCPASVYEMETSPDGARRLKLNPSNCVHCKTCDIMDPYQIIDWVCPEGGGGPRFEGL
ncbi:MAG: electron transfer flavoprotein-ubiquinone oxidoreductase [Acidobacteriota bacterium]